MWLNFINSRSYLISEEDVDPTKSAAWLEEQNTWMRSTIDSHQNGEDPFWRHLTYIIAQFDGLYDGYVSAARPDWVNNSQKLFYCRGTARCALTVTILSTDADE